MVVFGWVSVVDFVVVSVDLLGVVGVVDFFVVASGDLVVVDAVVDTSNVVLTVVDIELVEDF